MDLYTNIKYFIFGGAIMAGTNYILEKYHNGPALTAYLYCAPTIYLIIAYLIYKKRGLNGYYTFLIHSFINYVANVFIIVVLIILIKYTIGSMFKISFITLLLFMWYSIYYFINVYKLEFTP